MALDPSYFFYSDGTITLTNGSDIATGDTVVWDPAVLPFDFVFPNDGTAGMSVIAEVLSVNQIRLAKPWSGPDLTDVPYFMVRWANHIDPRFYAIRVSEYLARLKAIPENLDEVGQQIASDRQAVDAALAALEQIQTAVDEDRQAVDAAVGQAGALRDETQGLRNEAETYRDQAQQAAQDIQQGVVPDNAVSTVKIQDKAVTNAKMANMAANTIKGAIVAGAPVDLTPEQARAILGGFLLKQVVPITQSGTYTPSAGVRAIRVRGVAGGGGGGAGSNTQNTASMGSGGGAGAYAEALIISPAASYPVTIGAAGSGGVGGDGGTGGTTSFGSVFTLAGGIGGAGIAGGSSLALYPNTAGGAVTSAAAGVLAIAGNPATGGMRGDATLAVGGNGGPSPFGSGGGGGRVWASSAISSGGAASGYGAGGGGGARSFNGTGTVNGLGGPGGQGYIEVEEYI